MATGGRAVARKPYQLPPGVRYLTSDELDARRAAKRAGTKLEQLEDRATGSGWTVHLPKLRRGRRRRRLRPPAGIFGKPGKGF